MTTATAIPPAIKPTTPVGVKNTSIMFQFSISLLRHDLSFQDDTPSIAFGTLGSCQNPKSSPSWMASPICSTPPLRPLYHSSHFAPS